MGRGQVVEGSKGQPSREGVAKLETWGKDARGGAGGLWVIAEIWHRLEYSGGKTSQLEDSGGRTCCRQLVRGRVRAGHGYEA